MGTDKEFNSFLKWFVGFTDASNHRKYSTIKSINNNELSLVIWGTNLRSQVGTLSLSNHEIVNIRHYSTEGVAKLEPNFVTGFCDGEGSFKVSVKKNAKFKSGYQVRPDFSIALHRNDLSLLESIHSFFGVGKVYTINSRDEIYYRVGSLDEIVDVIIPHFLKFPLISQKRADFELFRSIVILMKNKQH